MAFTASSGWGNLPNGNFSPTIFSKKAQLAFRKTAVCEDITNTSYYGEIAAYGDTVRIMKEPEITVRSYTRGKTITPQELEDDDFQLVIDQANEFSFTMEDIEEKHSHIDFMDLASDRAAYKIRDVYDRDVLGYAAGFQYSLTAGTWSARTTASGTAADESADSDELLAANKLYADNFDSGAGSTDGIVVGVDGTFDATPIQIFNRANRVMNASSVPIEGRWAVVDPVYLEMLLDENSKAVNSDYNVGEGEGLNNGMVMMNKLRGFRLYMSNNLPTVGTGPSTIASTTTRDASNYGVILFGHDSAVATASQINKTEKIRSQFTFADIVRGLHLYGRKILRPEAIVRAVYNVNK